MPRRAYENWKPQAATLEMIAKAEALCESYNQQGFDLTLRQLYYQFVSRDWLSNTDKSYNRLGEIVNKARLAGYIDWNHITDRGRYVRSNSHWSGPDSIIRSAADSFMLDGWEGQAERVEVWVEKEALVSVVAAAATPEDVAYFPCKGYTSQSEMWGAAQRLVRYRREGHDVTILHLGDHDPSGLDMTRDIRDRLELFHGVDLWTGYKPGDMRGSLRVERIALNMDQVEQYDPPPNPAKVTDSRYEGYRAEYGEESWELDALEPSVLVELIREHIAQHRDEDVWLARHAEQEHQRESLTLVSDRWDAVQDFMAGTNEEE